MNLHVPFQFLQYRYKWTICFVTLVLVFVIVLPHLLSACNDIWSIFLLILDLLLLSVFLVYHHDHDWYKFSWPHHSFQKDCCRLSVNSQSFFIEVMIQAHHQLYFPSLPQGGGCCCCCCCCFCTILLGWTTRYLSWWSIIRIGCWFPTLICRCSRRFDYHGWMDWDIITLELSTEVITY